MFNRELLPHQKNTNPARPPDMARLMKTAFTMNAVRKYVETSGQKQPEIEHFLVEYLSVSFCAEMERQLENLCKERLSLDGNERLKHFLEKAPLGILGRKSKSDIVKTAAYFGERCKDLFKQECNKKIKPGEESIYRNVIDHRHKVAHGETGDGEESGGNIKITFHDMEKVVDVGEAILDSLEKAIR